MVEKRWEEEFIAPSANGLHEAPEGVLGPLTEDQLLAKFRAEVDACEFQKDWADAHGVSRQLVSEVMQGRARVRGLIAAALGYRMVARFEPIEDEDEKKS